MNLQNLIHKQKKEVFFTNNAKKTFSYNRLFLLFDPHITHQTIFLNPVKNIVYDLYIISIRKVLELLNKAIFFKAFSSEAK